ncbi:hypothetical protein JT358_06760 [Micrococcales bacterium 31B]|nr:hypothetical protein [Micrococcales bacterium 31B]
MNGLLPGWVEVALGLVARASDLICAGGGVPRVGRRGGGSPGSPRRGGSRASREARAKELRDREGGFDITRVLEVGERRVSVAGEIWVVRQISQGRSEKQYTCPGCLQPIAAGAGHIVAWLERGSWGRAQGLDARRHWHASCWRSHGR